jgi:hypothetical protein
MLNNPMLWLRPGHPLTEYVHFMRQAFDDYNETCEIIDSSAAIHPYHMGRLMLSSTTSTCQFSQGKYCVIDAFDTNYLLSANDVMASILHLAKNMETELPCMDLSTHDVTTPPVSAFIWQLAVGSMVDVVTPVVAVVLLVAVCLISKAHAVAWTTYFRHAQPLMLHS